MVDATPGPSNPRAAERKALRQRKADRSRARQQKKSRNEKSPLPAEGETPQKIKSDARYSYIPLSAASVSKCPVLYSTDGSLCFVPDTVSVRIYRSSTAQLASTLTPEDVAPDALVTAMMLNPTNPLQLQVASADGFLRTWDYVEGQEIRSFKLAPGVRHMCCSRERPNLLYFVSRIERQPASGVRSKSTRDTVMYVSLHRGGTAMTGQPRVLGRLPQVTGLALTHDGSYLIATCAKSGGIHIASTSAPQAGFANLEAGRQFTAIAIHPSELSFVTGDTKGRIQIWYPFDQQFWNAFVSATPDSRQRKIASAQSQTHHWHAHAVACLLYTGNGAYLASGGEEGVLVLWQLASGHKEFLPRLGAPISSISLSSTEHEFAISLADNSVIFVESSSLSPRRSIAGVKIDTTESKAPSYMSQPLAVQPGTQYLVFNSSHPSSIQFLSPLTNSHVLELDISPINRHSKTDEVPIEPARVERVAFSDADQTGTRWMATIDSWRGKHYTKEAYLKVWEFHSKESEAGSWSLDTRVDRPHGFSSVTGLAFADSAQHGLWLATCGNDGNICIWSRHKKVWKCGSVLSHRGMSPKALAWSSDGSLLAVAFRSEVGLWSITGGSTRLLSTFMAAGLQSLANIAFTGQSDEYVVAGGEQGLIAWHVMTGQEHIHVPCRVSVLLHHPQSDRFIALERSAANHKRRGYTIAFIVDTRERQITSRELPIAVKQAVLAHSRESISTIMAVTTDDGGIGLAGDDITAVASVPALPIDVLTASHARTLFDDLFGLKQDETVAKIQPHAYGITQRSDLPDVLQAPCHVLPPLSSIWRLLLPLPSKRADAVRLPADGAGMMDIDEPKRQSPETKRRPTLPVYNHDLGEMLNGLKL